VIANWNQRGHPDVGLSMTEQKTTEREQGVLKSLKLEMETQHSLEQVGLVHIKVKMEALPRAPNMKKARSSLKIMQFPTMVAQEEVEKIQHKNCTDELKIKHLTEEVVHIEAVVLLLCSNNA
jgi:hypothetical protein